MKIKVKEIPRDGLVIQEDVSAEEIGLSADDLKAVAPLKVQGQVYKARNVITAELAVWGKYEFSCMRCLEPVVLARNDTFDIHMDIDPTKDIADLGEEIRQEMLLNISTIVLCKESCKGLCVTCGANLNNQKCNCKR